MELNDIQSFELSRSRVCVHYISRLDCVDSVNRSALSAHVSLGWSKTFVTLGMRQCTLTVIQVGVNNKAGAELESAFTGLNLRLRAA